MSSPRDSQHLCAGTVTDYAETIYKEVIIRG